MEMLLSIILSIFIGFWLLGLIGKFFLRYWLLKKQRQMEQQMRDGGFSSNGGGFSGSFGSGAFRGFYGSGTAGGTNQNKSNPKPEGEVTIDKTNITSQHTINKKIGEYVDFEDVK